MAEEKNNWIEAISKLIKLTQEGKLQWSVAVDNEMSFQKTSDEKIDTVFRAYYKGRILRIYKRSYLAKLGLSFGGFSGIKNEPKPRLYTQVVLEIIDEEGKTLWSFPKAKILKDLLTTVEFRVAGVKDFLNDLLNE